MFLLIDSFFPLQSGKLQERVACGWHCPPLLWAAACPETLQVAQVWAALPSVPAPPLSCLLSFGLSWPVYLSILTLRRWTRPLSTFCFKRSGKSTQTIGLWAYLGTPGHRPGIRRQGLRLAGGPTWPRAPRKGWVTAGLVNLPSPLSPFPQPHQVMVE